MCLFLILNCHICCNMPIITIQWSLKGIENIGVSEDARIWRTPYTKGKSNYCLKEIIPRLHVNRQYFRIQNKRYTKEQINELSIKLENPQTFTVPDQNDVPFKS